MFKNVQKLFKNGFEATLCSKTNVLSVWKGHFSGFFYKFFSDEVETVFWESEEKRSKLFKSKFGHRKLLQKWFWSYLKLKHESSERLRRAFFSCLQTFEWRSRTAFWESEVKRSKLFKSKFGHRKLLKKWFWSYLKLKHESSVLLKSAFFSCLQTFEWRSRTAFGKVR